MVNAANLLAGLEQHVQADVPARVIAATVAEWLASVADDTATRADGIPGKSAYAEYKRDCLYERAVGFHLLAEEIRTEVARHG